MKNISFLTIFILFSSLVGFAQKKVDLRMKVISPENGHIVLSNDTLRIQVSLKNFGPDNIEGEGLIYKVEGYPFDLNIHDTILVGDSIILTPITLINMGEEETDTTTYCIYLDYTGINNVIDSNANNDTSCVNIILKGVGSNSIGNITNNNSSILNLFPNPATSKINFNVDPLGSKVKNVIITDITGKIIVQQQITNNLKNQVEFNLDISYFKPGLYILQLTTDNGRKVGKFLKL